MEIVTLISDPNARVLDASVIGELGKALHDEPKVLAPDEAVEFCIPGIDAATRRRLAGIISGRPIDIVVTPASNRKKRILICDMDSTIITTECIDELADLLGIRAQVAEITERTMNGELDFAQSVNARVALLHGLPETAIDELLAERIHLTPGAATLVRTMRWNGAYTALVSGGFTRFTGPVAERAGFDENRANELEILDHQLTGRLLPPLLDANAKLQVLDELVVRFGLSRRDVVAAGDGANDIPMIQAAGLGVGFRPHAKVADVAPAVIRHGDLTALLFIQGYPKSAFVQ